MDIIDKYQTLAHKSESLLKEKGSKFFGYAFPVTNVDDVKQRLEDVKEIHPKAKHHCYAYQIGVDGNNYRVNDAGEPSGTAGLPILGQLKSHEITNTLIVIVRYFGGTKLGVSGLISAYKLSSIEAIANNKIIEKSISDYYSIKFNYDQMNRVQRICKELQLETVNQAFEIDCKITVAITKSQSEAVMNQFGLLQNVKTTYLYTL
jgi:uncharacterized YigZ family protein